MKRAAILAVFLGLPGLCSPAFGADTFENRASAPSWTGVHIGVHAGVGMGKIAQTGLPPFALPTYHFGDTSLIAGLHFGYDHQFSPRWVGGIEADFTWLGGKYTPRPPNPTEFWTNWQASASARLGYLATPHTLVYGRLGISGIDFKAEDGFVAFATGTVPAVKIGVGAETFIGQNLTARVEANYLRPTSRFLAAGAGFEYDPRMLLITAGLSWRFGAEHGSTFSTPPASAVSWDGFYAGIAGSYNLTSTELGFNVPFATVGPYAAESPGLGIFAGYDFRVGERYLLGAELDATWLDLDLHDPAGNILLGTVVSRFARVRASFAATARVGWLPSDGTLLYVKGGIAGLLTEANPDFFPVSGGGTKLLPALQAGVGIETAITDNLTLRVEGLYTTALSGLDTNNAQIGQASIEPSLLTGRVGIAWRF